MGVTFIHVVKKKSSRDFRWESLFVFYREMPPGISGGSEFVLFCGEIPPVEKYLRGFLAVFLFPGQIPLGISGGSDLLFYREIPPGISGGSDFLGLMRKSFVGFRWEWLSCFIEKYIR